MGGSLLARYTLESFGTLWKIARYSVNFTEKLKSFLKHWKVSGNTRKFPDTLESLGIF